MLARFAAVVLVVACLSPSVARADGARYLIICPEAWEAEVQPLADWKTRKGMLARVATTAETGYSAAEIKSYIVDAVATWDPPPEYVLMVGDLNAMPMAYSNAGWGGYTDTYYGDIDEDTFIEIHPGRLPATSASEAEMMVEKTLQYERYPTTDPAYYLNGLMYLSEDWDDDDWLHYYGDAQWVQGLMTAAGYENVDLFTRGTTPDPTGSVQDAFNAGLSFGAYHGIPGWPMGWAGVDFEPWELDNGPMLPVVVVYTCKTLTGSMEGGEQWIRAGSPGNLRGAVAYIGQSIDCSYCAHWRSALRRGFWGHIFEDTTETDHVTLGTAVETGRQHYYNEFHETQQYVASVIYGDPELNVWTGVPADVAISHPPLVPCMEQEVTLSATLDGVPRENVLICLSGAAGAYAYGRTDENGQVTLSIDTTDETLLTLTATGRNMRPVEAEVEVAEAGGSEDDDDATGDDDTTTGDDDDSTAGDDDTTEDPSGDDDDTTTAGDDDDDDDLVNTPESSVGISGDTCACRQEGGEAPGSLLVLLGLAALGWRRR
jgi:hypothetical protein